MSKDQSMTTLWRRLKYAYSSDLYPPKPPEKQYLTDAERRAIMLTAEGNVCLAMGALCTAEKVSDMKREILAYVDKRPAY